MQQNKLRQQRLVVIAIVALVLLAVLLVILDWSDIRQVLGKANWGLSIIALLFTVISYLCLSFGYVIVNKVFGIGTGWRELLQVGLVSTALNNILAFLGAAGHSLRLALIKRPGVVAGEILAASVFHSYLNNIMMFFLLAVGLILLLCGHIVYGGGSVSLGLITGVLVLSLVVATAIILVNRLRMWVLHIFSTVLHFVTRRDLSPVLTDLDHALGYGIAALRAHKVTMTLLTVLMAADWAFAAVALWFCLDAFGNPPSIGVLLSGFGIGISAGNLSMLPGGIGVQEASMAGTYSLLGISFSQGVLAAILFRVVYDFVPFFASLALYKRLLREHKRANEPTDKDHGF